MFDTRKKPPCGFMSHNSAKATYFLIWKKRMGFGNTLFEGDVVTRYYTLQ